MEEILPWACIMGKGLKGVLWKLREVAKLLGWRSSMARDMDMCKIRNPRRSEGE